MKLFVLLFQSVFMLIGAAILIFVARAVSGDWFAGIAIIAGGLVLGCARKYLDTEHGARE